MTNKPTISVIIPAYNVPDCLIHAVDSALAQTMAPLEILIIDDHSTDNTLALAQALTGAHREVQVYSVPEGRDGVSAARNYGMEKASGELLTFLDADDTLEPTMLETLVQLMQETGADIVGCDFRNGDGSTKTYRGADIIARAILIDHDTRVWSKLYTRRSIKGITFPEDMTIGEDMLFLLSAAADRELTYVVTQQRLYNYTVNPVGAMERPFVPSYMDQIHCWDRAEQIMRTHDSVTTQESDSQGILTTDTFLRLRAVQIVSACLVGAKIARLPGKEQRQYVKEWNSARVSLKRYLLDSGARDYLPHGYGMKATLLDKAPHVFEVLCKKKQAYHNM